jgi:hypothetical protein
MALPEQSYQSRNDLRPLNRRSSSNFEAISWCGQVEVEQRLGVRRQKGERDAIERLWRAQTKTAAEAALPVAYSRARLEHG